MKRKMLIIIAVILTVLLAIPLWKPVGLFFWGGSDILFIITLTILLAAFGTILILATKISDAWLLGAVWTVTILLFAGFPTYYTILDYYHFDYKKRMMLKFESSVENGAPNDEIRRLAPKVDDHITFRALVENSRFDLAREIIEKGEYDVSYEYYYLEELICKKNEKANAQATFLIDLGVPLHNLILHAVSCNNIYAAKLLLQKGANPNEKSKISHKTPLCHAKSKGDRDEIIALLLEYGAVCEDEKNK